MVAHKQNKPKLYNTGFPEVNKVSDIDFSGTYSYANYLRWKFDERLELIKGKIFEMSPAPAAVHQLISWRISGELYNYLKNKSCQAFAAPFDVRLPGKSKEDQDIFTVVQPDISIICDPLKIDNNGCIGAPDIVVEILSPGNNRKELRIKYDLYQEFGVKEYWIVYPAENTIIKYALNEGGIFIGSQPYIGGSELASDILPGFQLNINQVFENIA